MPPVVAIFGPPGAGKTTAAKAAAEALGYEYLSSGDVAREVDPGALERGEMADRALLAAGFKRALERMVQHGIGVIVDGLPRDRTDVALLPDDTVYLLLNVAPSIGIDRQVRRGRDENDTFELADKRTTEQRALMELDARPGEPSWAFDLADGWVRSMQTNDKTREVVITHVIEFINGERKTLA